MDKWPSDERLREMEDKHVIYKGPCYDGCKNPENHPGSEYFGSCGCDGFADESIACHVCELVAAVKYNRRTDDPKSGTA